MKKSVDVQNFKKTLPDIPDVSLIFGGSSVCRFGMNEGLNNPSKKEDV